MQWVTRWAMAAAAAALVGCGGKGKTAGGADQPSGMGAGSTPDNVQITAQSRQQAQQIFSTRCSVCHGMTGHGDGPGSLALNPKPRNYHDKAWQDSVTDKEIETAIVYGGAAVGRSAAMVPNPDLAAKPDVVAALREIVRKFGKEQ
jgi:mono/diheme cytochrome c family protein